MYSSFPLRNPLIKKRKKQNFYNGIVTTGHGYGRGDTLWFVNTKNNATEFNSNYYLTGIRNDPYKKGILYACVQGTTGRFGIIDTNKNPVTYTDILPSNGYWDVAVGKNLVALDDLSFIRVLNKKSQTQLYTVTPSSYNNNARIFYTKYDLLVYNDYQSSGHKIQTFSGQTLINSVSLHTNYGFYAVYDLNTNLIYAMCQDNQAPVSGLTFYTFDTSLTKLYQSPTISFYNNSAYADIRVDQKNIWACWGPNFWKYDKSWNLIVSNTAEFSQLFPTDDKYIYGISLNTEYGTHVARILKADLSLVDVQSNLGFKIWGSRDF